FICPIILYQIHVQRLHRALAVETLYVYLVQDYGTNELEARMAAEPALRDKTAAEVKDEVIKIARLNAAERLAPIAFVLATGVEERAALLMDEARRTASDRRLIAIRYAG